MKTIITILMFLGTVFASDLPEEFNRELYNKGEKIFENKCTSCHEIYISMGSVVRNFFHENNDTLKLKAPTANQISFRLKQQIGDKNEMDFHLYETQSFLKDFLYTPNRAKTICLEGVIKYFETMPSMKDVVSEEEIENINHFLYFLEGFNGINEYYYDETKF